MDTIDPWFYVETFEPTMEHLRETIPSREFHTEELSFSELQNAVKEGKFDFFIAPSGFFAFVSDESGARHIATRHRALAPDPGQAAGSAFVVRSGDGRFKELKDLKGRTAAATASNSFDGWIIALGEIFKIDKDPEKFFRSVTFTGFGLPDVAALVLNHDADVGILKACELEQLEEDGTIEKGVLRIIGEKPAKGLACKVSTDLYPDVVFASLPKATSGLIREVSVALFMMPKASNGDGWGFASDFSPVLQLYRNLQIGPYEYLRELTPTALLRRYQIEIAVFAALLLLGASYVITVRRLVALRTRDLRIALEQKEKAEEEAKSSRERLYSLEKSGIVTGLSSLFAHESRQPIASLINYADGLKMYLKDGQDPMVKEALTEISEQAEKLSGIIEKVRSYVKREGRQRQNADLSEICRKAEESFRKSSLSKNIDLSLKLLPNALALIDPLEIELVLVNLLRNAGEALRGTGNPKIELELEEKGGKTWRISVSDNGPELPSEKLVEMLKPTVSSKKDGLGIGLSLCHSIAESHGGQLSFEKIKPHGLRVSIILPKAFGG